MSARSLAGLALALLLGGCTSAAAALGEPPPGSALWTGAWDSDEAWTVGGDVAAHLPDPLPTTPFEAEAAVRYGLCSLYRSNDVVRTRLTAQVLADGSAAGDNADEPILDAPVPLVFLFKGVPPGSEQVLEYEATLDASGTRLEGTYASAAPWDRGRFVLRRREP